MSRTLSESRLKETFDFACEDDGVLHISARTETRVKFPDYVVWQSLKKGSSARRMIEKLMKRWAGAEYFSPALVQRLIDFIAADAPAKEYYR